MKLIEYRIPAGLVDDNIEFFSHADLEVPFFVSAGVVHSCSEMSAEVYNIMLVDARRDRNWWGVLTSWHGADDRRKVYQHIACRYGSLNSKPDLSPKSGMLTPDLKFCDKCTDCVGFGLGCAKVDVLSKREMLTAILIAHGLSDKQIADLMIISLNTLNEYKKRISYKLDAHSKIDIVSKLLNAIL